MSRNCIKIALFTDRTPLGRESIYGAATGAMLRKQEREEQMLQCKREQAYRRGFDQALYLTFRYLGLEDEAIRELAWKEAVARWRNNWAKEKGDWQGPPVPDDIPLEELRAVVRRALQQGPMWGDE